MPTSTLLRTTVVHGTEPRRRAPSGSATIKGHFGGSYGLPAAVGKGPRYPGTRCPAKPTMTTEYQSSHLGANPRALSNTTGPSRLLSYQQAAHYLGFKSTAALKALPVKPIRLVPVGPGSSPKFDRRDLDRYLDGLSGLEEHPTPELASANDAEAAFSAWEQSYEARRR
jgi:hypothetical protein